MQERTYDYIERKNMSFLIPLYNVLFGVYYVRLFQRFMLVCEKYNDKFKVYYPQL